MFKNMKLLETSRLSPNSTDKVTGLPKGSAEIHPFKSSLHLNSLQRKQKPNMKHEEKGRREKYRG